jgi:sterol 14-demethylase
MGCMQLFFSKWGESGEVDLKLEFEHLIILTASRCLLGQEVRNNLFENVSSLFHDLDNGMLPISVLFPYLPIPAHRRRDRLVTNLPCVLIVVFDQMR